MPLLASTLAASLVFSAACSWNRPGVDPYRGDAAGALSHYTDIPTAQRHLLLEKIAAATPDDEVRIGRDTIAGKSDYDPVIRDMHFGKRRLCGTVDRSGWQPARSEPAAVYCAGEHCILVPRICGNVSRISLRPETAPTPEPARVAVIDVPRPAWEPASHPLDWALGIELGLEDSTPPDVDDEEDQPKRPIALPDPGGLPPWAWNPGTPVQAVPEASTWAMMVAGIGILAGWRRLAGRRHQ